MHLTKDMMDSLPRGVIFPPYWTSQQKLDRVVELVEFTGRVGGKTRADVALRTASYSTADVEELLNDDTFMWKMKTSYLLMQDGFGNDIAYLDERDGNGSNV